MGTCILSCFEVIKNVFISEGFTRITPIVLPFPIRSYVTRFLFINRAVTTFSFYLFKVTLVVLTNVLITVVTFSITTFVTVNILTCNDSITI